MSYRKIGPFGVPLLLGTGILALCYGKYFTGLSILVLLGILLAWLLTSPIPKGMVSGQKVYLASQARDRDTTLGDIAGSHVFICISFRRGEAIAM
jgi:hypothetical protein